MLESVESRPIRALVVDDEPMARRTLRRLIESEVGIECAGEVWGAETVDAIGEYGPDVVFLDVRMPGMSGFQVLERVPDDALPLVVFVTAFDEYAVRAFEVRAMDYLVKPFTDRRFREVVARLRDRLSRDRSGDLKRRMVRRAAEAAASGEDVERGRADEADRVVRTGRLVIRGTGGAVVVRHDEIDWLEAVGSYVRVHAGEVARLVRTSLTDLDRDLDPGVFHRIHRSSIVNLDRVREIEPLGHGDALIRLVDGTELRVSRSRRAAFETALGG